MVCYNYISFFLFVFFCLGDLIIIGSLVGNYLFICFGIKLGIFLIDMILCVYKNFKLFGGNILWIGVVIWLVNNVIYILLLYVFMIESKILWYYGIDVFLKIIRVLSVYEW